MIKFSQRRAEDASSPINRSGPIDNDRQDRAHDRVASRTYRSEAARDQLVNAYIQIGGMASCIVLFIESM